MRIVYILHNSDIPKNQTPSPLSTTTTHRLCVECGVVGSTTSELAHVAGDRDVVVVANIAVKVAAFRQPIVPTFCCLHNEMR